jgi:hypothetical protein
MSSSKRAVVIRERPSERLPASRIEQQRAAEHD